MKIRVLFLAVATAMLTCSASASWYAALYQKCGEWFSPFGTNGVNNANEPRLSELMEPASLAIDEAADLIADGKTDEAAEKYREALRSLERIEIENPERAATPEFQSVRNKRAYVDAQLNAILIEDAKLNAKAVAVTDTTGLEEKLRKKRAKEAAKGKDEKDEKGLAKDGAARPKLERQIDEYMEGARARDEKISRAAATARFERESEEKIKELFAKDPESRKARLMRAGLELYRKNYGNARKDLEILLVNNPEDVSALNILGAVEAATGNYSAAETALIKAIRANDADYHAYYNLAKLTYKRTNGKDRARAKKLYEAGRKPKEDGGPGGPEDPYLEGLFK